LKDCLNLTKEKVLQEYYRNSQSSTIVALELECSGRDLNPGPRLSSYCKSCREAVIHSPLIRFDRTILPELRKMVLS